MRCTSFSPDTIRSAPTMSPARTMKPRTGGRTCSELVERAYEDAYRQFIEPVVGASGEQLARARAPIHRGAGEINHR